MHAAAVTLLSWAMIVAACFVPSATSVAGPVMLGLLVALIGLPHGAADHRFARPLLEPRLGKAWLPLFLAVYLLVGAAMVIGWSISSAATITIFFIASAWHFGQEEPCLGGRSRARLYRFARGGLVIWTPLACRGDEVRHILKMTAPLGVDVQVEAAVSMLSVLSQLMIVVAAIAWGLQVRRAQASKGLKRRVLALDCVMVASMVALFATTNPLVGFLVYFCAWHSARGLRSLRRQLDESWRELAKSLAPMTLLAVLLIASGSWLLWRGLSLDDFLVRSTFLGLSAVATPHLLLHSVAPMLRQVSRLGDSPGLAVGGQP